MFILLNYIILTISLYVTNTVNSNNNPSPIYDTVSSTFSDTFFLVTHSISTNNIFPPSSGGNGNIFATPTAMLIIAIRKKKFNSASLFETASAIPTIPHILSKGTLPANKSTYEPTILFIFSTVSINAYEILDFVVAILAIPKSKTSVASGTIL